MKAKLERQCHSSGAAAHDQYWGSHRWTHVATFGHVPYSVPGGRVRADLAGLLRLLWPVIMLRSPNDLPYCAAKVGHLVGRGSTDYKLA